MYDKLTRRVLLCISICTSLVVASSLNESTRVDLGYAEVFGAINATRNTITYHGLQFAQPPTGGLRWRAPVPIEDSSDNTTKQTIDATQLGAQCVQGFPGWSSAEPAPGRQSSEDCLRLDVIIPEQAKSESLPVVVQIHGGGYTLGNSETSDGHPFVDYANGSVIWVQIQYRLGAYGFLGGAEVEQDGDTNIGLLDQRLALEWVQTHIHSFGGDPRQVTIWGSSAGGGSVTNQLIAYGGQSNPPFRAAIPEYPWWQPFHDNKTLSSQYEVLLLAANCTDIACLRSLDYETLANATQTTYIDAYASGLYGYGDFYYGPYVDGKFIQDFPSEEFAQGHWSKVPILVDHNGFEGLVFTNASITTRAETISTLKTVFQADDPAIIARFEQLYPNADFGASYISDNEFFSDPAFEAIANVFNLSETNSEYWRLQTVIGDTFINCGTYVMGLAAGNSGVPFWKLVFNAGSYLHGATAPFLFGDSSASANATLADIMKDYYLSFVVNLDPNTGSQQPWPQYASNSTNNFQILQVNATSIGVREDADVGGRCDFWNSQSYFVKN